MQQDYDGDGLRVKKTENGSTTYYLRSTVLGGQAVAEINDSGGWARGYVYAGGSLLAVQYGGVNWVHEDAITKSKRITDASGQVVSNGVVELDPWGANTARSSSSAFQPQVFTSYIADANGGQDAMARRYSAAGRFSQPDPYGGSYDSTDPQSFNRYAYTKNDPVNFRDPSGLNAESGGGNCEVTWTAIGWFQGDTLVAVTNFTMTMHCTGGGSSGTSGGSGFITTGGTGGTDPAGGPQKTPSLKNATPDQQKRFTDAYNEFLKRLQGDNGKNACAKLFGGLSNAVRTLAKTNFIAESIEGAAARAVDNTIKIDPAKGFMDTSGSLSITVGYALNNSNRSFDPLTITLGNVAGAAFILAHEFAHRANVKGFNPDDAEGISINGITVGPVGANNNEMIREACFSEYTPR